MAEPELVRGWSGWTAVGDGVATHATNKEEARRRFHAAARDQHVDGRESGPSAAFIEVLGEDVRVEDPGRV